MDFIRKLLLKLSRGNEGNSCKPEDNMEDDPGNVVYKTIEQGYKYPEVEIGCGITIMKRKNEL